MHTLATDIGGTHARAAIVEGDSGNWRTIGPVRDIPTPDTLPAFLDWLHSLVGDAEGVAVGIAGRVRDHRTVLQSPNISFIRTAATDLGTAVQEKTGLASVVVNDMEAALAGELIAGALTGCRWAFMDTVSTGWGGALLLDGEVIAAEPGHTPSGLFEGRQCGLGHPDCNEAHFSGSQVETRVRLILKQKKVRLPTDRNPLALSDEAVRTGERWAVELYRYVAEGIGKAWAYRLNLLPNIERIVYTGGFLTPAMELAVFRDAIRNTIRIWAPDRADIPIERARAEHGAILGAACLFSKISQ